MAMARIGWSAGFTLRRVGGDGIFGGSLRSTDAMAVCTSWAAPSSDRSSENWMVMLDDPKELVEDIESTPAMVVNCRSRGAATDEAMVSGLAPGSDACT